MHGHVNVKLGSKFATCLKSWHSKLICFSELKLRLFPQWGDITQFIAVLFCTEFIKTELGITNVIYCIVWSDLLYKTFSIVWSSISVAWLSQLFCTSRSNIVKEITFSNCKFHSQESLLNFFLTWHNSCKKLLNQFWEKQTWLSDVWLTVHRNSEWIRKAN